MKSGLMNGSSVVANDATAPKAVVRADHLIMLERSAQALSVMSTGVTKVQALSLKVAKGEVSADTAYAVLSTLG